jgi:hypothetical protein
VNELITNALKYAYPNSKGEILVRLSSDSENVTITVSDAGVGLPSDFDWKKSKTLGMTIIHALTKQLDGNLEIGPPPGATFTLRIPQESRKDARFSSNISAE